MQLTEAGYWNKIQCAWKSDMQGALRMAAVEVWLLCRICMISRFHVSAVP